MNIRRKADGDVLRSRSKKKNGGVIYFETTRQSSAYVCRCLMMKALRCSDALKLDVLQYMTMFSFS